MAPDKEKETNKELFESMPMPRALATLAVPTIIGQLIVLIYNLADTYFIGRIGDPLMVAGVSLILPLFNFALPISNLIGVGGSSLISRLLGRGEAEYARRVSSFCLYASIGVALLFSMGTLAFMKPLLSVLGASSATERFARQYALCVIVLGAVPTVVSMTFANMLRSVGLARQAGFGVSMGGVINIGLDPLFMFVLFPGGMEIMGAGIATVTSNVIACLYFIAVILRERGRIVLTLSPRTGVPRREDIRSIFSVGIPSALSTLLYDVNYIVLNKMISFCGDIPVAAIGIVLKAERLPLNVGVGLAQGMMPLAAYNYSAKNYDRMKKAANQSRLAGLVFAACSIVLYLVFSRQIIGFFIKDSATIALGSKFLRIRILTTPFVFMCFHLALMFQAVGRGDRSLIMALVRWAAFNIPMLFIMNALAGMYGLIWSSLIADLLTLVVYFRLYRSFLRTLTKAQAG